MVSQLKITRKVDTYNIIDVDTKPMYWFVIEF